MFESNTFQPKSLKYLGIIYLILLFFGGKLSVITKMPLFLFTIYLPYIKIHYHGLAPWIVVHLIHAASVKNKIHDLQRHIFYYL